MENLHLLHDTYYKGFIHSNQWYEQFKTRDLYLQVHWGKNICLFFFIMSKILDIPAAEAFDCNTDGNLASEWEKWKKRFRHYVAAAGLSDNK